MTKVPTWLAITASAAILTSCSTASAPDVPQINHQPTSTALINPIASMSNPHITMETSMGTVQLELFADKTPITTENFVKLAKAGFYNGVLFHRVIPGFMAQAGDPLTKDSDPYNDGTGGPGYTIEDEIVPGLANIRGAIAMANKGAPHTAGCQFFINVVDNHFLDGDYTVFGKVTAGMDIVDKIVKVPTNHTDKRLKDRPVNEVKIISVKVES